MWSLCALKAEADRGQWNVFGGWRLAEPNGIVEIHLSFEFSKQKAISYKG